VPRLSCPCPQTAIPIANPEVTRGWNRCWIATRLHAINGSSRSSCRLGKVFLSRIAASVSIERGGMSG
jgi:hypothetical protein